MRRLPRRADRRYRALIEVRCRLAVAVGLRTPQLGPAKFFSRSHDAVIHVYDESGSVMGLIAQRNTLRPIQVKLTEEIMLPSHSLL
jgi:hypothetical protein